MRRFFALPIALLLVAPLHAAEQGQLPPRSDEEILKTVQLPEGYAATVFAKPPSAGYPTSVSAAVDGTIFVAIDENGSLGRDRNGAEKARGRVIRMRDTDGDGKADEFKTFATMESPRGVIWDGASGTSPGTLYVMHPPTLTAYTDTDGDGVADQQEDILTGLGFTLDFRGADHTTNGCRLAIDGFIYIAMGDYGCVEAKGKDGRTIKHRGGGIVRIRPDGTGLELVVEGTRNIYDVAVSPTLDIFTRDNTNDGGGWNVRLSHNPPGAHMGYPTLFVNFAEDHLQPLADFGGGSPCGALWMDEPGLPQGLFTVEWGAGGIMYHDDLKRDGAGWKLTLPPSAEIDPASTHKRPPLKQNKWISMTRPTDMDVDASGRIYVTSWEGATFNYNGPNAGYVLRLTKKDLPVKAPPQLAESGTADLANLLTAPSGVLRLAAQREILRRAKHDPELQFPIPNFADPKLAPAAVFASINTGFELLRLKGALPERVKESLDDPQSGLELEEDAMVAGLEAIGSHPELVQNIPVRAVRVALQAPMQRVRMSALNALRRLNRTDAVGEIVPLLADGDPTIAHLATRALVQLKATDALLGALDSSDENVKPGALRALYWIYEPAVVDGLIARLPGAKGEYRHGLLNALCRLDNQDAPYLDPTEWWSTRPDTSGPVYKPTKWSESEKIEAALKRESSIATGEDARWLVQRMYLTKVNMPGLVEQMLAACGNDAPARLTAIEGLFRPNNSLPPEAVTALASTVESEGEAPEMRARAMRMLQRGSESDSIFPTALTVFAPMAGHDLPNPALTSAFEDFTHDAKNGKWLAEYKKALLGNEAAPRSLAATVLVNLAATRVGKEKERKQAQEIIDGAWAKPEPAAALLAAIARSGAKSFAAQVKAKLNDPNNAVAEAALFAFQKLGLNDQAAPAKLIGAMTYEEVVAAVSKGGDAKAGQEMFLRAGCIACHTIMPDEPPKGPILSAVVKIYDRAALIESILKPSAKIAQGFESQWFKTNKGVTIEGFVTREGGDSLDVRNILGQTEKLEKADIVERGTRPQSIMPEGLMAPFTPAEMSNLLAWLESLKK